MKSAEGYVKRGLVALFVCSFLLPALASAGGRSSTKYQYAVKFICGNITEDTGQVVPGDYATAINILEKSP